MVPKDKAPQREGPPSRFQDNKLKNNIMTLNIKPMPGMAINLLTHMIEGLKEVLKVKKISYKTEGISILVNWTHMTKV